MSTENQKLSITQKLAQTPATQVVALPEVADRFKGLYAIFHGNNSARASVAYESEKFHFMKMLQDKPDLQKCTKLSLYGTFLDMAVMGLSFDPSMKHAYVISMPFNVGSKNDPKWESRACLMVDGRGELVIRVKQGQIKHADNPITVFEGDVFKYGTKNDKVFIEHEASFPRKEDAQIIACYIRLERPDGTVDYKVFGYEDVMALKKFSKQPNSLAWTAGIRGMIETKTLKHAFKSYPKVKLGSFSQLQTAAIEPENAPEFKIDYGLEEGELQPVIINPEVKAVPEKKKTEAKGIEYAVVADDSFVDSAKPTTGKHIEDDQF